MKTLKVTYEKFLLISFFPVELKLHAEELHFYEKSIHSKIFFKDFVIFRDFLKFFGDLTCGRRPI